MIVNWLIISLFLFMSPPAPGPSNNDDSTIAWSQVRRLSWTDFKGRPAAGSPNAALTSSKILFRYSFSSDEDLKYDISFLFEKNNSWGRVRNDLILSHEQGHFDISEIYARRLYKALKAYRPNEKTMAKDLSALYKKAMETQSA